MSAKGSAKKKAQNTKLITKKIAEKVFSRAGVILFYSQMIEKQLALLLVPSQAIIRGHVGISSQDAIENELWTMTIVGVYCLVEDKQGTTFNKLIEKSSKGIAPHLNTPFLDDAQRVRLRPELAAIKPFFKRINILRNNEEGHTGNDYVPSRVFDMPLETEKDILEVYNRCVALMQSIHKERGGKGKSAMPDFQHEITQEIERLYAI